MNVFDEKLFKGQNIVVTGAGSGFGREFAIQPARCGANRLILSGRRLEPLQETAALIGAEKCIVQQCDIRQYDQCENLIRTALQQCQKVGV